MGRAKIAYLQLANFTNQISELKRFDIKALKTWEKILADMTKNDEGKFVDPNTELKIDVIRAIIKFKKNKEDL